MFEIQRDYTFDAAHQLPHLLPHNHKCRRLHGHTYYVSVRVGSHSIDERGMLMDFAELDEVVKPIIQAMDHRYLSSGDEDLVRHLPPDQVFSIGKATTAENLAAFIGLVLDRSLSPYPMLEVVVKETPKSYAVWRRADE